MTAQTDLLIQYSDARAAHAEQAKAHVVGIRAGHRLLSGILWEARLVVTSEQSLPEAESYSCVLPGGEAVTAAPAGRDASTNIALLRLASDAKPSPVVAVADARAGALALAYGSDGAGGVSARHGAVRSAGPAWTSSRGGRIDAGVALDLRLARSEEGGPVFDATGGLVGMTTFGPRGRVIAIPHATLARVVPALARDGAISRGWLGIKLQPVEVPDGLRETAGQRTALMAMSVAEGSPAALAGIAVGDIILTIGDAPAGQLRDVAEKLGAESIGQRLDIRFLRGGKLEARVCTITARPKA